MTDVRLTDERLAWLAVRDEVARRTPPPLLLRILGAATLDYGSGDAARDVRDSRRRRYMFAVDDAAGRLNADERRLLRQTGQVPAWFLPYVEDNLPRRP